MSENRGSVVVTNAAKSEQYAINGTCQTVADALSKFFNLTSETDCFPELEVRVNNRLVAADNYNSTPLVDGTAIVALSKEIASAGFKGQ